MSEHKPWYKRFGLIVTAGIAILVLLAIFIFSSHQSAATISDQAYAPTDSTSNDSLTSENVNLEKLKSFVRTNHTPPIDTSNLDSQINGIISSNPDIIISVSIRDLTNGTTHDYGNLNAMTAASVSKVLTAVDYLKQVELGLKSLDTIMANGYTAQYNIEQMIVISDNDCWHVLNDSLTYTQMQQYAESIGLTSYNYVDNTISTKDVTKLLGDLYERNLIKESSTELLLSYMERANFRDLIIPAVPESDTVYHKAGWLYSYLNDSTIITNSTNSIVLTIFTDSIKNYDKARISSIMQQITTPALETFHLN